MKESLIRLPHVFGTTADSGAWRCEDHRHADNLLRNCKFRSVFLDPRRLWRATVTDGPSTLLKFHDLLKKRKHRLLQKKPGPHRPSQEYIPAIVETKQINPHLGCRRNARQLSKAFGADLAEDSVRRVITEDFRFFQTHVAYLLRFSD
jgi:hypothetical protein